MLGVYIGFQNCICTNYKCIYCKFGKYRIMASCICSSIVSALGVCSITSLSYVAMDLQVLKLNVSFASSFIYLLLTVTECNLYSLRIKWCLMMPFFLIAFHVSTVAISSRCFRKCKLHNALLSIPWPLTM